MPTIHLTKSAIDSLPTLGKETVYWDAGTPGFGVKVTPRGRKVFQVLYRLGGAGSRLRKYTIGPYGRVTLAQAKAEAMQVFAARLAGRDPAGEKRERRRQLVVDRVDRALTDYVAKRLSQNKSGPAIGRMLQREVGAAWGLRSLHDIKPRDVADVINGVMDRGTPVAANILLKWTKSFFTWCIAQGLIECSPATGIGRPAKEVARDRFLSDDELRRVLSACRQLGVYGAAVETLALTAQRRSEVLGMSWDELDLDKAIWALPGTRIKNRKPHIVHLSERVREIIAVQPKNGSLVFSMTGRTQLGRLNYWKGLLDEASGVTGWTIHDLRRTAVSGMAARGVAPHVADKILNHKSGSISGVAAVYQRHEFLAERKDALDRWSRHVVALVAGPTSDG